MVKNELVNWSYELEFAKVSEDEREILYVAGEASNGMEDHDEENMDMDSLKSAFTEYMKNPVVKFMHDKAPQHIGAIGVVVKKFVDSEGKEWRTKFGKTPFLVAKFEKDTMPPWMWNAINKKVYKGFSIGGKAFKKGKGTIYVKSWLETSVVDIPAAKGAFFSVLKSACVGGNCPIDKMGVDIPIALKAANIDAFIKARTPAPLAGISEAADGFLKCSEKEEALKRKKEAEKSATKKFVDIVDDFLKGGKGSGQKGHRNAEKPDIKNITMRFAAMDIKEVKKKLLRHYNAGEIQEMDSKHGEKALRARLQSAVTGKPVGFKKMAEMMGAN